MTRLGILFLAAGMALFACALCAQAAQWQWGDMLDAWSGDLNSMATDAVGNTYIIGSFTGTLVLGPFTLTTGRRAVVIAKIDPNGNWLWARQNTYSGNALAQGKRIAVDDSSNVYISGQYRGTIALGGFSISNTGWYDVYVAKLDTDGNWIWVQKPDVDDDDLSYANGMCLDAQANIYLTGEYSGSLSLGGMTLVSEAGFEEMYIAKLDRNGNCLLIDSHDGSGIEDYSIGFGIGADAAQNIYVAGYYNESITFGTVTLTCDAYYEMYIAKRDAAGTWLWAQRVDLCDFSESWFEIDLEVDSAANMYISFPFDGSIVLDDTPIPTDYAGNLLAKLSPAGDLLWAYTLGEGAFLDWEIDITLDADDNLYTTSYFTGSLTLGDYNLVTDPDWYDIIVGKLDPTGNWVWAQGGCATSDEGGIQLSLDAANNIYVLGSFSETIVLGDSTFYSQGHEYFLGKLSPVDGPAIPRAPVNLLIIRSGGNIVLDWDPVTLDTLGRPITPDHYLVYYHGSRPDGTFNLLAQTPTTIYTHTGAATLYRGYYRVRAVLLED